MRPIAKITLFAVAASMAAPAIAAADIYLKLGDIKGESAGRSAAGAQVAVSSWSWGADQGSAQESAKKGWDGTIKGNPKVAEAAATTDSADPSGAAPDTATTGQKRQHGWNTVSKPLDRGSLMVTGNLPGCTVGAAYADAVLQTPDARFEFKDAIITDCAMPSLSGSGGDGGDRPTESITLSYSSYRESPTRASQK